MQTREPHDSWLALASFFFIDKTTLSQCSKRMQWSNAVNMVQVAGYTIDGKVYKISNSTSQEKQMCRKAVCRDQRKWKHMCMRSNEQHKAQENKKVENNRQEPIKLINVMHQSKHRGTEALPLGWCSKNRNCSTGLKFFISFLSGQCWSLCLINFGKVKN